MTQGESRNGVVLQEVDGWVPLIKVVLADVGLVGAAVYGQVWCFCQMRGGACWASLETIAEEVGLSKSTVLRHIKALCAAGYLRDTTPGRTNRPHIYADTARAVIGGRIEARLSSSPTEETVGGAESPSQQFGGVSERHRQQFGGVSERHPTVSERYCGGVRETLKDMIRDDLRDQGEGKPPDAADAASGAAAPPPRPFSFPDPSGLTVKEIGRLDLDGDQWRELGDAEARGRGRAGVREVVERRLRAAPEAVEGYRDVAECYPKRALWAAITAAVGDEREDLDFWRRVVVAWVGNGWRPTNVRGMLEFYGRREIPPLTGRRKGDGRGSRGWTATTGGVTRKPPIGVANTPTPEQIEADRRALAEHRERRAAEAAGGGDGEPFAADV